MRGKYQDQIINSAKYLLNIQFLLYLLKKFNLSLCNTLRINIEIST